MVVVRTLPGPSVSLDLESSTTIADVKARIQNGWNIPADRQRLVFAGRQLANGSTLAECNVFPDSTIHLVIAPHDPAREAALLAGEAVGKIAFRTGLIRESSNRMVLEVDIDTPFSAIKLRALEEERARDPDLQILAEQVRFVLAGHVLDDMCTPRSFLLSKGWASRCELELPLAAPNGHTHMRGVVVVHHGERSISLRCVQVGAYVLTQWVHTVDGVAAGRRVVCC